MTPLSKEQLEEMSTKIQAVHKVVADMANQLIMIVPKDNMAYDQMVINICGIQMWARAAIEQSYLIPDKGEKDESTPN